MSDGSVTVCRGEAIAEWEHRVSAAYLRLLGATQTDAGRSVGRSRRTLQRWEADAETWALARQEACHRWLAVPIATARRTLLRALRAGDARTARWLLERAVPELAPPKTRDEITLRLVNTQ